MKALHNFQCILQIVKQHEKKLGTMRLNGLSKIQKIWATPEPPHRYTGFQLTSSPDLQHTDYRARNALTQLFTSCSGGFN